MSRRRITRAHVDELARIVSRATGEHISVSKHATDSPRCYSIERHNLYNDQLTRSLDFGPTIGTARARFTLTEVALILSGADYGAELMIRATADQSRPLHHACDHCGASASDSVTYTCNDCQYDTPDNLKRALRYLSAAIRFGWDEDLPQALADAESLAGLYETFNPDALDHE